MMVSDNGKHFSVPATLFRMMFYPHSINTIEIVRRLRPGKDKLHSTFLHGLVPWLKWHVINKHPV